MLGAPRTGLSYLARLSTRLRAPMIERRLEQVEASIATISCLPYNRAVGGLN